MLFSSTGIFGAWDFQGGEWEEKGDSALWSSTHCSTGTGSAPSLVSCLLRREEKEAIALHRTASRACGAACSPARECSFFPKVIKVWVKSSCPWANRCQRLCGSPKNKDLLLKDSKCREYLA